MNPLSNLKIRTRLSLGFGIIVLLLVAVSVTSVQRLKRLDAQLRFLAQDRIVKLVDVARAKDISNSSALEVRDMALSGDSASIERSIALIAENSAKMSEILTKAESMVVSDKGKELVRAVNASRKTYAGKRAHFIDLLRARNGDAARAYLVKDMASAHAAYFSALDALSQQQLRDVDATVESAAQEYRGSLDLALGLTLAAVTIAVAIALAVARSITRPVNEAVAAAAALQQGDFTHAIAEGGKDEIGSMLNALRTAFATLSGLVGGVKTTAETISTAAREIAQGNTDLSQRTEEQAASLEETAASMEEITGTVKQNADNARQASQLATNAAEVAEKGSHTVQGVVTTMQGISEASSKISDIISVIEGIAFQTNILALNAAVEAARAGEQGRGFAVVASEVRSLAQRSATAAKEIKDLITDSVDRVQAGAQQATLAGSTMSEVLASIKRVNDIMGEIASASNEQSAGIDQVGKAVQQMDEVTQQNAALVEQASAAAHSLEAQSQDLRAAVAVFRTDESAVRVPRAAVTVPRVAVAASRASPTSAVARPLVRRASLLKRPASHVAAARPALAGADGDWERF